MKNLKEMSDREIINYNIDVKYNMGSDYFEVYERILEYLNKKRIRNRYRSYEVLEIREKTTLLMDNDDIVYFETNLFSGYISGKRYKERKKLLCV